MQYIANNKTVILIEPIIDRRKSNINTKKI